MEEREHLSKTLARTRGDKERTHHWPGIVEEKIAAESSQKTQYPPQFTFRIRNHCKSSVNRMTTAVQANAYCTCDVSSLEHALMLSKHCPEHVHSVFA